ncbi:MAG: hypothetical protein WB510_19020 [Candidatus Sulfotelmatobacter sp.]
MRFLSMKGFSWAPAFAGAQRETAPPKVNDGAMRVKQNGAPSPALEFTSGAESLLDGLHRVAQRFQRCY